jgi:CRISPR-associated exonuclease Cas4
MLTVRDVALAAYCPRKLYYRRREPDAERSPPAAVEAVRDLAFDYPALLADASRLQDAPIEDCPAAYQSHLRGAKARLDAWPAIADPPARDVHLSGEACRGVAHKRLPGPSLSLVFAGSPPDRGVWHPQSVRLVAAARALADEDGGAVDRVYAEYPAHGVIRAVDLDARRLGAYREALRTARSIDGPPSRTSDRAKCDPCEYTDRCGVRTRSLLSRLRS